MGKGSVILWRLRNKSEQSAVEISPPPTDRIGTPSGVLDYDYSRRSGLGLSFSCHQPPTSYHPPPAIYLAHKLEEAAAWEKKDVKLKPGRAQRRTMTAAGIGLRRVTTTDGWRPPTVDGHRRVTKTDWWRPPTDDGHRRMTATDG